MKITLRKAHALQLLILEAAAGLIPAPTVTIGRYDDPLAKFAEGRALYDQRLKKRAALMDVYYEIRRQTARAGADVGVNDILTGLAANAAAGTVFTPTAKLTDFAPTDEQVKAAHADLVATLATPMSRQYGVRESLTVSVVGRDVVDAAVDILANVRHQKTSLSDRLLHLNMNTEIDVDTLTVALLKEHKLL